MQVPDQWAGSRSLRVYLSQDQNRSWRPTLGLVMLGQRVTFVTEWHHDGGTAPTDSVPTLVMHEWVVSPGEYTGGRVDKAGGKQRVKKVTPGGIGRHKQSQHAVGTNGVVGEIEQYWGRDEMGPRRGTGYAVGQP